MTTENIHYKIIVQTGQSGIDSNVILCIFGDENTTTNLPLKTLKDGSNAKFEKDSILEFDLQSIDVGTIKHINIGHDGKGSEEQWYLKSIEIEMKENKFTFTADRWLSEEKDDNKTFIDLLPDESIKEPLSALVLIKNPIQYKIKIVTSSEDHSGTDSGVLMTIIGDKDITQQFPLTKTKQGELASFQTGITNKFEIELNDVGTITKINIGQDGTGSNPKWQLESVHIGKGTENYDFISKTTLDKSTPFVDLTPTPIDKKDEKMAPVQQIIKPKNETTYNVSIQTDSDQPDQDLYLIIFGENNQTEKIYLKEKKTDFQFKTNDVGKISKIIVGQDNNNNVSLHIDHITIKRNSETTTFNVEKTLKPNSKIELSPSTIPKKIDATYKILIRPGSKNENENENDHQLNLIIFGQNGQTKKIPLNQTINTHKTSDKIEYEIKLNDVGKISKIILSQDPNENENSCQIDNITIKRNNETTTFNVERKLEQNSNIELKPSPIPKRTETPRKTVKTSDTVSKTELKTKDADYHITTTTGDKALDASATLKIRGDNGTVSIPLKTTTNGEKPFQSKSTNEFSCQTTNVGKIRQITVEHDGTDRNLVWHLKSIQIKKGNETTNFNADVCLDHKQNSMNLYPVGVIHGQRREDYVQTELRRLRESLRAESIKLNPPIHKAYEPFVYNDLSPYFDTRAVERAIYGPLEIPPGYYTRVTALRIVEPWEAYGMDYGVNFELAKQRNNRSFSARRPNPAPTNESIDRTQGSTHLPKYPCVSMQKPAEYSRSLTMADVPKIRSFIRGRYSANAASQTERDYKRTHNDIYRMQLDHLEGYHESNRENMLRIYHSYLENKPGSKKALHELCQQVTPKSPKPTNETAV